MSCKTTSLLAAYIDESHDSLGVLELIRTKYPKSISTYLTQIKKEWLTLNKTCDTYAHDYSVLISTVRSWKAKAFSAESKTLEAALEKLLQFNAMSMQDKYNVQRSLKNHNFTGHTATDDLLSKLTILPPYILDLKVDCTERLTLQQKSATALIEKSSDSMTVEASKLLTRVNTILQSKKSNPFDLACALSCVTGRRMIEIFKTGCFEPVAHQPRACVFTGQAKKQFVHDGFKIPLLANLSIIQTGLERLRISKSTEDMNNAETNLKYSSSCNAAARRLFGQKRTFHTCRAVYGVLSFHVAMPHTYSLNLWLSKVLGHASLVNSLNYSSIHISALEEEDKHPFQFD